MFAVWLMTIRLDVVFALVSFVVAFAGCRAFQEEPVGTNVPQVPAGKPLNPLPVPMLDRELVMDEVSDEIDNYFPILTEQRIQNVNGVLSEGWIETRPKVGGSIFEPWKKDSTPGFEKWHATVPNDFMFFPKLEQSISHFRRLKDVQCGFIVPKLASFSRVSINVGPQHVLVQS